MGEQPPVPNHENERRNEDAGASSRAPFPSLEAGASVGQPLDAVWRQFGDQLRRRARTRLRQYGLTGQAESMDICNDVMADMTQRYGSQGITPMTS